MYKANPGKNSTVSGTSGRRYLPGEAIDAADIPEVSILGMLADESIVEITEPVAAAPAGNIGDQTGNAPNAPKTPKPAGLKPVALSPENRAKLEAKAVSAGVGVPEYVATLSDSELKEKVKAAKQ